MSVILREVSIAANSTNDNLVSGSSFELARQRQVVSLGLTAAATGVIANINAGSDVVAERFAAPIATRYAIIPDEMYFQELMEPGDRLVVTAQNTTGGAIITRLVAQITPV